MEVAESREGDKVRETGSLGGGEATREIGEWPRSVPAGRSDVRRHLV